MFIVWGTRIKRKRVGRVADYCTVCHSYRSFGLVRIGAAGHLYGVSIGSGQLRGHEIVCEECRTPSRTEFDRFHSVSRDRGLDLDALIHQTHPRLEERSAEIRRLEERVCAGQASPEERRDLLMAPFLLVNPMLEQQSHENRLSPKGRNTAAVMLALFVAFMVLMGVSESSDRNFQPIIAATGIALVASFTLFLYFWATSMGAFIKSEIEPRLARALGPFDPASAELEAIVQHLKDGDLATGRKLKPARLHAAFANAALAPGSQDRAA